MNKTLIVLFLSFSSSAIAALPPKYQLQRDLSNITSLANDLMVFKSLIRKKETYKLKYVSNKNELCFINFKRKKQEKSIILVGPVAQLIIADKSCNANYQNK